VSLLLRVGGLLVAVHGLLGSGLDWQSSELRLEFLEDSTQIEWNGGLLLLLHGQRCGRLLLFGR
jgi:hypothetical protein